MPEGIAPDSHNHEPSHRGGHEQPDPIQVQAELLDNAWQDAIKAGSHVAAPQEYLDARDDPAARQRLIATHLRREAALHSPPGVEEQRPEMDEFMAEAIRIDNEWQHPQGHDRVIEKLPPEYIAVVNDRDARVQVLAEHLRSQDRERKVAAAAAFEDRVTAALAEYEENMRQGNAVAARIGFPGDPRSARQAMADHLRNQDALNAKLEAERLETATRDIALIQDLIDSGRLSANATRILHEATIKLGK